MSILNGVGVIPTDSGMESGTPTRRKKRMGTLMFSSTKELKRARMEKKQQRIGQCDTSQKNRNSAFEDKCMNMTTIKLKIFATHDIGEVSDVVMVKIDLDNNDPHESPKVCIPN